MLLKCTRENETTYYIPSQIKKITISPVYGKEDAFDVSLFIHGRDTEIVAVYSSREEAEAAVLKIYDLILNEKEVGILDLNA